MVWFCSVQFSDCLELKSPVYRTTVFSATQRKFPCAIGIGESCWLHQDRSSFVKVLANTLLSKSIQICLWAKVVSKCNWPVALKA